MDLENNQLPDITQINSKIESLTIIISHNLMQAQNLFDIMNLLQIEVIPSLSTVGKLAAETPKLIDMLNQATPLIKELSMLTTQIATIPSSLEEANKLLDQALLSNLILQDKNFFKALNQLSLQADLLKELPNLVIISDFSDNINKLTSQISEFLPILEAFIPSAQGLLNPTSQANEPIISADKDVLESLEGVVAPVDENGDDESTLLGSTDSVSI
ncbi:hypothetical protein [Rickettsia endosymbiont of Halotydeus destructor]|uniref:hypothetical protein n=1 Tax=Rickettsia endosymbiont of Halotydeus destructor TaxID=2996754 RepID=UPI003BAF3B27